EAHRGTPHLPVLDPGGDGAYRAQMSRRPGHQPLWHLLFIPLIGGAIIGYLCWEGSRFDPFGPSHAERKAISAARTCEALDRLYDKYSTDSYGSPTDAAAKTTEKMRTLHCELPMATPD